MLTAQQQLFVQALEELDLNQVKKLLADGLNPNFIDMEKARSFLSGQMVCSSGGKKFVRLMKQAMFYLTKKNNRSFKCILIFWMP